MCCILRKVYHANEDKTVDVEIIVISENATENNANVNVPDEENDDGVNNDENSPEEDAGDNASFGPQ